MPFWRNWASSGACRVQMQDKIYASTAWHVMLSVPMQYKRYMCILVAELENLQIKAISTPVAYTETWRERAGMLRRRNQCDREGHTAESAREAWLVRQNSSVWKSRHTDATNTDMISEVRWRVNPWSFIQWKCLESVTGDKEKQTLQFFSSATANLWPMVL